MLPNFYLIFSAPNRAFLLWDHALHASILSAVACLGLCYVIIGLVARFILRPYRLFATVVSGAGLFFVVRAVVSILDRSQALPMDVANWINATQSKLLYYGALAFLPAALAPRGVLRLIRTGGLILFPLVLMLIFIPLTYKVYSKGDTVGFSEIVRPEDLRTAAVGTTPQTNIVILICDEWSYDRSLSSVASKELMPFTRRLMEESVSFRHAISAGSTTKVAVPRMLLPFDKTVTSADYGELTHLIDEERVQANGSDSLFSMVGSNYVKLISGFFFDYGVLLSNETDYIRFYHDADSFFRSYGSEFKRLMWTQLSFLRFVGWAPQPILRYGWRLAQDMGPKDLMYTVDYVRRPYFAVLHLCLPHYLYIWTKDGERKWTEDDATKPIVSNYLGNVEYLDTVIERAVTSIKQDVAERGDKTLLVLTSDHAWRVDPDLSDWDSLMGYPYEEVDTDETSPFRHVPLILWTGKPEDRGVVEAPFRVADLHKLISRFLADQPLIADEE